MKLHVDGASSLRFNPFAYIDQPIKIGKPLTKIIHNIIVRIFPEQNFFCNLAWADIRLIGTDIHFHIILPRNVEWVFRCHLHRQRPFHQS